MELSRAGRDAPSPEEPLDFELALFIDALLETGAAALDRDLARVLIPSSASPSSCTLPSSTFALDKDRECPWRDDLERDEADAEVEMDELRGRITPGPETEREVDELRARVARIGPVEGSSNSDEGDTEIETDGGLPLAVAPATARPDEA